MGEIRCRKEKYLRHLVLGYLHDWLHQHWVHRRPIDSIIKSSFCAKLLVFLKQYLVEAEDEEDGTTMVSGVEYG